MKPELDALKAWLGQPLPAVFVAALEQHGDRLVEPDLLLYAADELLECNRAFETFLYCLGYLAIDNDSNSHAVAMALDDHWQVLFLISHGATTPGCFEPLAPSPKAWLGAGPCLPE